MPEFLTHLATLLSALDTLSAFALFVQLSTVFLLLASFISEGGSS